MTLDINNIKNLDEINDSRVYAKIPNNFFYNDAEILNLIGGRNSFLIYCLLTSRKNMGDYIYISIKEIISIFQFEKNVSRSKQNIVESLILLKDNEYINFKVDLNSININEIIKIHWIGKFPKLGGVGWIKFYADDFEVHSKIGNIPYIVMWMLRMYVNFETKTSFISITNMSDILKCDRNKIQNAINVFRLSKLFIVEIGEYYTHSETGRRIRENNQYQYTGSIDELMNMDDLIIKNILFPERRSSKNIKGVD